MKVPAVAPQPEQDRGDARPDPLGLVAVGAGAAGLIEAVLRTAW